MSTINFVPAQPGDFGYFIKESTNPGCKIWLERHPLIGFATKVDVTDSGELTAMTQPVCLIGESNPPDFICRYDGIFTDSNGDQLSHSLIEMMQHFGFEPDDARIPPLDSAKELQEYVWRPIRNL